MSGGGAWNLSYADDPTDWDSDHAYLKDLDSSLRCALCYDIFTAPVSIRDCGHTFCSACIRRAINKPGEEMGSRCPNCMGKNVYDSSLVPQATLEIVAQNWRSSRPRLYAEQGRVATLQDQLAEQAASASTSAAGALSNGVPSKKRRLPSSSGENVEQSSSPPRRRSERARSMTSRNHVNGSAEARSAAFFEGSEDGSEYEDKEQGERMTSAKEAPHASKDYRQMQANDMADCPLCGHSFTLVALNRHLDKGTCNPGDPEPSPQERGLPTNPSSAAGANTGRQGWFQKSSPSVGADARASPSNGTTPAWPVRKKLVKPNYDMVKLPELKRMLEKLLLSSAGDRKRLVERHRMWANLYNANLDASEKMRKSDRELRRELESLERAQDYAAAHGGVSEKRAKTWTADHADDFKRLAQQARESHMRNRQKHKEGEATKADVVGPKNAKGENGSIHSSHNGHNGPFDPPQQHPDRQVATFPQAARQPSSSPPQVVEPGA